jgi:hypothetical protein
MWFLLPLTSGKIKPSVMAGLELSRWRLTANQS